jgi:hypothetical protein
MQFDLVDEMQWEDLVEFESLESAGLETYDKDTVPGAMQQYFEDER